MAMTRLVEPLRIVPVVPYEPHNVEQDFRGISPRPDLSERITPSKRVVKAPARLSSSNSKALNASAKSAKTRPKVSARKSGKKG